jgi:hypothetical protein
MSGDGKRLQDDGPISSSMYDSSDLRFLQELVDSLLEELLDAHEYLFETNNRDVLRLQLAAAVFKCSEAGDRDHDALRRRVLETFSAPSSATRFAS